MSCFWISQVFGIVVALHFASSSFRKPDYVETCSRNDPKLNECALKNGLKVIPHIIKGDSKLKVPVLDPLIIERIELVPSGNTRSVGLVIKCLQCQVIGLKDIKLTSIRFDLEGMKLQVDATLPQLVLEGNYETRGRVLVLPVSGKGHGSLVAKDNKVKVNLDYGMVRRKNQEHAQIKSYKVDFETSRLNIKLQNLFNGDKLLGDNLNRFLNENWREVLEDLYPTISETIGEIIKSIVNQVFMQIPFDEIFPNT